MMRQCIHYPCTSESANPYNYLLITALNNLGYQTIPCNSIWKLHRAVFLGNCSVVHFHWLDRASGSFSRKPRQLVWQLSIIIILFYTKLRRIPAVWTVHNLDAHNDSTYKYRFFRLISFLVSHLIVHSPEAMEIVAKSYHVSIDKLSFIPHGLYPKALTIQSSSSSSNITFPRPLRLMYFGNISPYKGVDILVAAFQQISKELGSKGPELYVIGTLDHSRYPEIVRDNVDISKLHVISGFTEEQTLAEYLAMCDLVVLPFRSTLTSGSLIYSLCAAKPVLVSNIRALNFYLSSSFSFTFNPGDHDSLAEQLTYICTHFSSSCLHLMGEQARKFSLTLDWESIARKTLKLYTSLSSEAR
jgi:beta-1,4-mannosyltransferase